MDNLKSISIRKYIDMDSLIKSVIYLNKFNGQQIISSNTHFGKIINLDIWIKSCSKIKYIKQHYLL